MGEKFEVPTFGPFPKHILVDRNYRLWEEKQLAERFAASTASTSTVATTPASTKAALKP